MTREEFEQYAKENGLVVWSKEMSEKAIKALEQEPTTKNDLGVDCISREATVKRLCNLAEYMNEHKENSGDPYIMAALFIQDNKTEFPSVTPQEPKTGHWIGIDEEPHEDYECDMCGYVIWAIDNLEEYKFCPNCGAKMVEPQESEEQNGNDD